MLELKRVMDSEAVLSKGEKSAFRRLFNQALDDNGEFIIGVMSTDNIVARFRHQGFWSGVNYRIKIDLETNSLYAEPRRFGN